MPVHLLLQPLSALAHGLERAALRIDRGALVRPAHCLGPLVAAFALLAPEVALGLLHVPLGLFEVLLAFHAEALQHALHLGQSILQRLLAIAELLSVGSGVVLIGVRGVVALALLRFALVVGFGLSLLVGRRPPPPLPPLLVLLVAAECVVAQRLLVAHQLAEFVNLFPKLALGRTFLFAFGALHVLEHVLHLVEHRLGLFPRAVASGLVELVQQLVEALDLLIRLLGRLLAVAFGLLRHFGGEAFGGFAQVLHQPADLVVARAALQRLAQGLLGCAQVALRLGGIALLDLERHRPEELRDVQKIGVGACAIERGPRLLEAEIDARRSFEQLRRHGEAGQCGVDPLGRMVRIQDEVASLLDQRAGERIAERPLRQGHLGRRALAGLARDAGRAECHRDFGAGPRVLGEVEGRMGLACPVGGARRLEAGFRRGRQTARRRLRRIVRQGEPGARAGHAVSVLDPVGEAQRAAEIGLRVGGQADRGRAGSDHRKGDLGGFCPAAQDRRPSVAMNRPAPLGRRTPGRFRRVVDRRDRALDLGGDRARLAADDQDRILERGESLRGGGGDVDHDRRTAGVGRRIDPRVDPAPRRREFRITAAPVEGGGEPAVKLGAGRDRGRKGHHRDAETQGVRVAFDHARGRRLDLGRLDRPGELGLMRRPHGARHRIVGIGEIVGERGGGPVRRPRIPIEARRDVARRRPAKSNERRERDQDPEREQDDARNPERARRDEPGAEPGHRQEQDRDEERRHDRRPGALDHQRAARRARQGRHPAGDARHGVDWLRPVVLRHARPDRCAKDATLTLTKAEVCRGRSYPRNSAVGG